EDATLVGAGESTGEVLDDVGGLQRGERTFAEALGEVFALEELHDDEGQPLGGDAVVQDLDDVGALDLGGGGGLAGEALDGGGVGGKLLAHELDDDVGAEGEVPGDPDGAHGAAPVATDEADLGGDQGACLGVHVESPGHARVPAWNWYHQSSSPGEE